MRQHRKLPGQNNFPKSDSRTQMLRSGSNESERKARDLKTTISTVIEISPCRIEGGSNVKFFILNYLGLKAIEFQEP